MIFCICFVASVTSFVLDQKEVAWNVSELLSPHLLSSAPNPDSHSKSSPLQMALLLLLLLLFHIQQLTVLGTP